jgi:hypothetical protein
VPSTDGTKHTESPYAATRPTPILCVDQLIEMAMSPNLLLYP